MLQSVLPERTDDSEEEDKEEWAGVEEEKTIQPVVKELEVRPKVSERQRVINAKEELSNAAILLNEDPEENVRCFMRRRRRRNLLGHLAHQICGLGWATQEATRNIGG